MEYVLNAVEIYKGLVAQMRIIREYYFTGGSASVRTGCAGGSIMSGAYGLDSFIRTDDRPDRGERYATGGTFTVGGSGGIDSTPVGFMATPGETVTVGGGTSDMENVLAEIRLLVKSLPTTIADAIERS